MSKHAPNPAVLELWSRRRPPAASTKGWAASGGHPFVGILMFFVFLWFFGLGSSLHITNRNIISGKHAQELYADFYMPPKASQSDQIVNKTWILAVTYMSKSCRDVSFATQNRLRERSTILHRACNVLVPTLQGVVYYWVLFIGS